MNLTTLLEGIEVKFLAEILSVLKEIRDAKGSSDLSQEILNVLKGIAMDTTALKAGFSQFSTDFTKFVADVTAFVQANVPQDTPQQIADVKTVTDSLATFDSQVQGLDALVNPAPPAPPVVA